MTWPPKNCNRLTPLWHDFSHYIQKIQGPPCSPSHSLPALVGSHFFWHPSTWCRTSDRRSPEMDLWDWWNHPRPPAGKTQTAWNDVFFPQRIMTTCDWWLYVLWYVSTENWVSSNQNINEVHNQLELNARQTQSSGWSPDCPSSRVLWNISIPAMVAFMGFSWHTGGRFKDAWCSQIYSEGIIAKIMHCCQCRTQSAIPLRLAFG